MPRRHEATAGELLGLWIAASDYWDKMESKVDLPWVEARFKLAIFKTTLKQKNWRVPLHLGVI